MDPPLLSCSNTLAPPCTDSPLDLHDTDSHGTLDCMVLMACNGRRSSLTHPALHIPEISPVVLQAAMCRTCGDATQQGRPLNGPASRTPEVAAIPSCSATLKGSFVRGLLVNLLAYSMSPVALWGISECCLLKVANEFCTQDTQYEHLC